MPRLSRRVVALALAASFAAIAYARWEPYTFLHGDGTFYANINKSLLNDGSLDQGPYHPHSWLEDDLGWNRSLDQGWSNVSLGRDGRWLPKHSFVLPLASTPFFAAFGLGGLLLFNGLMMLVALVAAFEVARTVLSTGVAAVATLLVTAEPIVTGDVYSYNNDVFYTAALMCGLWAFVRGRSVAAGLLFGLGVWAKVTNVLFVAPFGLWLLFRRDWRAVARFSVALAVPLTLFAATNWYFYGSPMTTSYHRILVRVDGRLATESISEKFGKEPVKEGLKRILLDEREGLVPKAPLLALALPGLLVLAARRRTLPHALAFLAIVAAFLALHSRYGYTYARFFLPIATLAVLPIGALLSALAATSLDRFRPWLALRTADGRWNARLLVAGGVALLAVVAVATLRTPAPGWRLSDHVEAARVTADGKRCDYFNNQRQKWECKGDPSHEFFWGLALGKQCTFDGKPRRMLWLHPPPQAREKRIAFPHAGGGRQLRVSYGLAGTSRAKDATVELRVNDRAVPLPPMAAPGALVTATLDAPLSPDGNTLEIVVRAPPVHWRHLCFDATILP